MRSGRVAAGGANAAAAPEQRLTLILSLLRLYRVAEPEPARLQQMVDEVRQAEIRESGSAAAASPELSQQRMALCEAAVRHFLATGT